MSINLKGASAEERARYAALVRPARQSAGMSQLELATIADVDRTTVSNVERGAFAPQAEVLRRLLRALGIATDERSDVEVQLWGAMLESLLLALPHERRATAADDAIAVLAGHVRDSGLSEAPASVRRIVESMPRGHAEQPIAAKRGTQRREQRHAE